MSKLVKQMELDALTKTFGSVRDMVLLTSDKVEAALDYNFRKQLRDKKVKVQMVKNTLVKKVLDTNGVKVENVWAGRTLIAWGSDSIKGLSKTIDTVIKDIEKKDPKAKNKITIKTAVADGFQCKFEDAMKMPTRLEAIGEIVAMILGPGSELASCLTGPGGQVASQIATLADRKEEVVVAAPAAEKVAEPAAAPAPPEPPAA